MRSPFIGGILSRLQDRWPNLFSRPFWAEYPYFLQCLAVSAFACLPFAITAMYLKEWYDTSHRQWNSTIR